MLVFDDDDDDRAPLARVEHRRFQRALLIPTIDSAPFPCQLSVHSTLGSSIFNPPLSLLSPELLLFFTLPRPSVITAIPRALAHRALCAFANFHGLQLPVDRLLVLSRTQGTSDRFLPHRGC